MLSVREAHRLKAERRGLVEGYLERVNEVVKKSKILKEDLAPKEVVLVEPTPVKIDQNYADLHCAREVKGRRLVVENEGDLDQADLELQLKAERILSDHHKKT